MRSCMERFERICTPRTGPSVSFRGGSGVYQTSAMPIPKGRAFAQGHQARPKRINDAKTALFDG